VTVSGRKFKENLKVDGESFGQAKSTAGEH